jgi:hypothetical protein
MTVPALSGGNLDGGMGFATIGLSVKDKRGLSAFPIGRIPYRA